MVDSGQERDLERGLLAGEDLDAEPPASYVARLSTWLTAVTTSRNIFHDGAGQQIEAERQALAEERGMLEAERLNFALLVATERQRLETEDRRLATEDRRLVGESQRLVADRRALADERKEFDRQREEHRLRMASQDTAAHQSFISQRRALAGAIR